MFRVLATAAAVLLTMTMPFASRAGLDLNTADLPLTSFELVVVEAEGCIYCGLFRRDVLPAYQTSEQGREMPARFIDINDTDSAQLALKSPVDIVPTFIVTKDHKEIGRISGYVGPENFFHSISYLMASAP